MKTVYVTFTTLLSFEVEDDYTKENIDYEINNHPVAQYANDIEIEVC